jgi:dCMP deaminase
MKRFDYIGWNEFFMGVAELAAKRSKDPNTQVGACIVDINNKIIGTGYNGLPNGFSDDDFPWSKTGDFLDTKYPYVVHAELNAILNSNMNLKNSIIYVTLFPCNECAKAIVQAGIKQVLYLDDKYKDTDSHKASIRIFNECDVKYNKLEFFKRSEKK